MVPRVFVVSDIHTDFEENMQCVGSRATPHANDAIILAGDVSDDLSGASGDPRPLRLEVPACIFHTRESRALVQTTRALKGRRVRGGQGDNPDLMTKLERVFSGCATSGVEQPRPIGDGEKAVDRPRWWQVQAHSLLRLRAHRPETRVHLPHLVMSDFRLCEWPGLDPKDDSVAEAMDAVNDARGWGTCSGCEGPSSRRRTRPCPSCPSAPLPRLELCPEKRMLFYPNLPKAVGSDFVMRRIQTFAPSSRRALARADSRALLRAHVLRLGRHDRRGAVHPGARLLPARVEAAARVLIVGPDANGRDFDFSGQRPPSRRSSTGRDTPEARAQDEREVERPLRDNPHAARHGARVVGVGIRPERQGRTMSRTMSRPSSAGVGRAGGGFSRRV